MCTDVCTKKHPWPRTLQDDFSLLLSNGQPPPAQLVELTLYNILRPSHLSAYSLQSIFTFGCKPTMYVYCQIILSSTHLSNIYCSGLLLIEEEDDCFFVFIFFIYCVPIVFLLDHHIIIKIIIITKREGVPSGKMNETIVVYFMIGQKILDSAFHCRSL